MQRKNQRLCAVLLLLVAVWWGLPFSVKASSGVPQQEKKGKEEAIAAEVTVPDPERKGSLTIHKYDITAAEAAGVYHRGQTKATGLSDGRMETVLSDYAVEGVQFTCLRTGSMEVYSRTDGADNEIRLVYEIPEELRKILGLDSGDAVDMTQPGLTWNCYAADTVHYTATQLSKALQKRLLEDETGTKDALERYLYTYGRADDNRDGVARQEAFSLPKTDARGETKAEGLLQGLYLVVETEVPEMVTDTVDPWFVSLPFTSTASGEEDEQTGYAGGDAWLYDMVCYPKNQTGNPTLDKSVRQEGGAAYGDTATASAGDTLEYTLVSRMPRITSKATWLNRYSFTDQLSQGLMYNRDVRVAWYKNAGDAAGNLQEKALDIWTPSSGLYTVTYGDVQKDKEGKQRSQMTVELNEKGLKRVNGGDGDSPFDGRKNASGLYMVVFYTATLTPDARIVLGDEGNPNDVQLTWSRTSYDYSSTLEDRNYVYTYGIDLKKTFSPKPEDVPLPDKVRFRLYNSTDRCYLIADGSGQKGLYYVKQKTEKEDEATLFCPDSDGKLWIYGLEGDSYVLTEVTTADGYQLLKEPVDITIRAADREVIASVAGTTGLTEKSEDTIVKAYGDGIRNEDGQLVTDAKSAWEGDSPVSGPVHEEKNGRSTGKTPLYEGDIHSATATVNGQETQMVCDSATASADPASLNAVVQLEVINTRGFLLPQTGGNGLYLVTVLGVLIVGAGCMLLKKRNR